MQGSTRLQVICESILSDKMNKSFCLFSVMIGVLFSGMVAAVDTTSNMITLSVTVVAPTCTISDSQKEQTINLGSWATSHFSKSGDVSANIPFSITLTECPSYGSLSTVFSGVSSSNNSSLLALSEGSTAKNIAIEILNSDGSQLPLNERSSVVSLNSSGEAELSYYSRYVSTDSSITAGTADGVATFIIYYD